MRKIVIVLFICLLLSAQCISFADENINSDWWNDNWSCRKLITISHLITDVYLYNFPLLIQIYSDIDLLNNAQPDGEDIVFILYNDNTTQLNHEIEFYNNENGNFVVWVNIPILSSEYDTKIWMYYKNSDCENQESPKDVWDNNYIMVQHLEESNGFLYDSTLYNNNGLNINDSATHNAVGKIDGMYDFNGEDDYLTIPNSSSLNITDEVTISVWVKLDDNKMYNPIIRKGQSHISDINEDGYIDDTDKSILFQHIIQYSGVNISKPYPRSDINGDGKVDALDKGPLYAALISNAFNPPFWSLQISDLDGQNTSYCYFYLNGTETPRLKSTKTFNNSEIGIWYHITAVYNGSYTLLYINGELDNVQENSGAIDIVNSSLFIGSDEYRYNFGGAIDEIRISKIARTEEWVRTNYNMMSNPSTYLIFGNEESINGEPIGQLVINCPTTILENQNFTVTVTSNNIPIEHVNVTFDNIKNITNIDGQTIFTAPEVKTNTKYTIIASLKGYVENTKTIIILNQKEKIGWIWGVVYDNSGILLEGAMICIELTDTNSQCVPTNDLGQYVLSAPIGTYDISVSKEGYETSNESVTINENIANELNFNLKKIEEYNPPSKNDDQEKVEYAIQEGKIGAELTINTNDCYKETIYLDDLKITSSTIDDKEIVFGINRENTEGTSIIVAIDKPLQKINVKIDGIQINSVNDLSEIFDLEENDQFKYYIFKEGEYTKLAINIPEFSDHTITIVYELVEILGGPVAVVLYIVFCGIIAVVIGSPILFGPHHTYFKKKRSK